MDKRGQHVVPTERGGWAVRKAGSSRASGTFRTRDEAVARARILAKKQGTEVYVHGPDGKIRSRDSSGRDPQPVQG
jgi:hypothetical protein